MTKVVLILVQNTAEGDIAGSSMFVKVINRSTMTGFLYNGDKFMIRDRHFLEMVQGLELIALLKSPSVKLKKEEEIKLKAMIR